MAEGAAPGPERRAIDNIRHANLYLITHMSE